MSKAKMIITTLIAAIAFSALISASASAATVGWMVNGTLLSGSEPLATTAKVENSVGVLKSAGADVEVECIGSTLNGKEPKIESPNTGQATDLEFTGCTAKTTNCTIGASTITTVPVGVEATLEGALAVIATFKPKTKTTFATFEFQGSKCASEGLNAVTGTAKVLAPTGQDESATQLITSIATEASTELKVASSPASLTGSALLKLASGAPWSFL